MDMNCENCAFWIPPIHMPVDQRTTRMRRERGVCNRYLDHFDIDRLNTNACDTCDDHEPIED